MSTQGQEAEDTSSETSNLVSSRNSVSLESEATGTRETLSQQNQGSNNLGGSSVVRNESTEKPLPQPPESSSKSIEEVSISRTRNVVIFGESGSGKSSIINAIAEEGLSVTSGDAIGCTFRSQPHRVKISGHSYRLFDTVGLNEANEGKVPAAEAEANLKNLLQEFLKPRSDGIGLLVYCVRGPRVRHALSRNYNIFYSAICRKKVPIVVVITGLENQEGNMESWWKTNEKEFQKCGMHFKDHACVTTLRKEPNTPDVFIQRLAKSSEALRSLITNNYSEWAVDDSLIKLMLAGVRDLIGSRRSGISSPPVVIICDPPHGEIEIADCINVQTCNVHIDREVYEVHRVPQPREPGAEVISSDGRRPEANLLIYYTRMDEEDVRRNFQSFYAEYGGNAVPVIVVVKGSRDRKDASQWVESNIMENGMGHLVSAFIPDPNNNTARQEAGQELRELMRRSYLVRYGRGSNTGGFLKRIRARLR